MCLSLRIFYTHLYGIISNYPRPSLLVPAMALLYGQKSELMVWGLWCTSSNGLAFIFHSENLKLSSQSCGTLIVSNLKVLSFHIHCGILVM